LLLVVAEQVETKVLVVAEQEGTERVKILEIRTQLPR
jgi:hypothetical protein